MYDLVVYNKTSITPNPPITTMPGTLAVGNREWNPAGRWDANFGGDSTHPSWAYMDNRGPREGFNDQMKWKWSTHIHIDTAGTTGAKGYVGLHSDPRPYTGSADPDTRNAITFMLEKTAVANQFNVFLVAWDSLGQKSVSVSYTTFVPPALLMFQVQYDPATRIVRFDFCDATTHVSSANFSLTLPSDRVYENMTMLASRDDPDTTHAVQMTCYLSEMKIEWLDVDEDWVIMVANEGCAILNTTRTYDRSQPPHKTQVAAQGRPWDSCYHDGAGPLTIKLKGILQVDDPDVLQYIDQLLLTACKLGTIIELHSYLTGYTLYDGEIVSWEMPNDVERVNNLDFQLVVRSRREPDVE